jgi:surface antigen
MSREKESAVSDLMGVGKLLTLILFSINVAADDLSNPRFFEYRSGDFVNEILVLSFGWFKTLDDNEKHAYFSAINHAVFYAEDGQEVRWNQGKAWGLAMPAVTWSTGGGYCRRIHVQASKYGQTKTMSRTACYQVGLDQWKWYSDK